MRKTYVLKIDIPIDDKNNVRTVSVVNLFVTQSNETLQMKLFLRSHVWVPMIREERRIQAKM